MVSLHGALASPLLASGPPSRTEKGGISSSSRLPPAQQSHNSNMRRDRYGVIYPRIEPLFERDVCSDAFGPDFSTSTCVPSDTLCCVESGETYPSCQQYLGRGWCCLGDDDTDNCYVDQPSACDEPDSVPCTDLADGVSQACCPALTSCAANVTASEDLVRCNIQYGNLRDASGSTDPAVSVSYTTDAASPSLTLIPLSLTALTPLTPLTILTTSSTSSGESLTLATSPAATLSAQTQSSSGSLSGGAIAGIVIGALAAVLFVLSFGWFFLRRRNQRRLGQAVYAPAQQQPPPPPQQEEKTILSPVIGTGQEAVQGRDSAPVELHNSQIYELESQYVPSASPSPRPPEHPS